MGKHTMRIEHDEINKIWDDHLTPTEIINVVSDGYQSSTTRSTVSDVNANTEAFTMVDLPVVQPVRREPQDIMVAPLGQRTRVKMAVDVYRQGRHRRRQSGLSWAIEELKKHPRRLMVIAGFSLAIGSTVGFGQVVSGDSPTTVVIQHSPHAKRSSVSGHTRHRVTVTYAASPAPKPAKKATIRVVPTHQPVPVHTYKPTPRPTQTHSQKPTSTPKPSPTISHVVKPTQSVSPRATLSTPVTPRVSPTN